MDLKFFSKFFKLFILILLKVPIVMLFFIGIVLLAFSWIILNSFDFSKEIEQNEKSDTKTKDRSDM